MEEERILWRSFKWKLYCFTYTLHSSCILSMFCYLLSISVTYYEMFGLGTMQWTTHKIVFGKWRLLCHLDSNPYQTRATATLLCVCQSAVQCMSSWSLARDIYTDNKTTRTDLLSESPILFSAGHSSQKWSICFRKIRVWEHKNVCPECDSECDLARRVLRVAFPINSMLNTATSSWENTV